jgi:hypothetical protein
VYAPDEGIGVFGGETDNWRWPRHTGDWSYLRAYVGKDGKPAEYSKENVPFAPKHWLKISTSELNEGDLVIVAGYPGRTSRHLTADEFRAAKEFTFPRSIEETEAVLGILRAESARSDEARILLASRIESSANNLKRSQGTLDGMNRKNLLDTKLRDEAALRSWIAADATRSKRYGGALEEIEALNGRKRATRERDVVMAWLTRSSTLFGQGGTIHRLAVEKRKRDAERKPGYQERDVPRISAASDRAQKTLEMASERALLARYLGQAGTLPREQRIRAIDDALGATGESTLDAQVAKLVDRLIAGTKVGDASARRAMLAETPAQLEARGDAVLQLVAAMLPQQLASEREEDEIAGFMAVARPKYMEAMRAMRGGMLYPDANGTLRVSFGVVEGYKPRDGVSYKPQTTVAGLLEKETGVNPFNSPKALLDAVREGRTNGYVDAELGTVPLDFLAMADTTGGSSGSPTLNRNGELCGLGFDGVYEAMAKDWVFDTELTRSIHVDSRYMLWVMDYVDHAHALMREMGVEPKSAAR